MTRPPFKALADELHGRIARFSQALVGHSQVFQGFQDGTDGHHVLGDAYAATLTEYTSHFKAEGWDSAHQKTVEQWVLLGDPSLMLGGYPS